MFWIARAERAFIMPAGRYGLGASSVSSELIAGSRICQSWHSCLRTEELEQSGHRTPCHSPCLGLDANPVAASALRHIALAALGVEMAITSTAGKAETRASLMLGEPFVEDSRRRRFPVSPFPIWLPGWSSRRRCGMGRGGCSASRRACWRIGKLEEVSASHRNRRS